MVMGLVEYSREIRLKKSRETYDKYLGTAGIFGMNLRKLLRVTE